MPAKTTDPAATPTSAAIRVRDIALGFTYHVSENAVFNEYGLSHSVIV